MGSNGIKSNEAPRSFKETLITSLYKVAQASYNGPRDSDQPLGF